MFCNSCGNYNAEGAQTCASCGAALMQEQSYAQNQAAFNESQNANYQPYSAQQNPYGQQPYGQTPYAPVSVEQEDDSVPGKGPGVASLILGIISLALFCIPVFGFIVAVVGLILGIVSVSKAGKAGKKCGVGIAGLICSGIGLLIGVIYVVGFAAVLAEEVSSGFYY